MLLGNPGQPPFGGGGGGPRLGMRRLVAPEDELVDPASNADFHSSPCPVSLGLLSVEMISN